MTTVTLLTTQFMCTVTYHDAGRIAKLSLADNNLQHLLTIISNMDDLEILEIHIYKES